MSTSTKSGIARLLEIAGSKKWLLILSGTLVLLHAFMALIPYIIIFYILQELIQFGTATLITYNYLLWALMAIAVSFILLYASGMASHVAAFNILYELRCKIAEKLGRLPMGYINNSSTGALKKILADDVERIEEFVAHSIPDFVKGVALPVIIITYLFFVDWRLALISFVPLIIVFVFVTVVFSSKENKEAMQLYHDSLEKMNAGIIEFVHALPVMKIFGQSASAFSKYNDEVQRFDQLVKEWVKRQSPPWAVFMSFINNATLPVLALGLYFYFQNSLTLPVLFLFLILGVGYIRPILALSSLGSQLSMINMGVKRMDEILFQTKEQIGGDLPFPNTAAIAFEQVSFAYDEGIRVLDNVTFQMKPNSITALVGPSGSGKSTAAQLIARYFEVNSGTITIDNTPIQSIQIEALYNHISFVFQDNMMFYQTIRENIAMDGNYSNDEIIKAAKTARCHNFIQKLPQGYDTHFGDKGIHLSGGEQQRIQLARAVLKDAPILILDEATAFSDPENEQQIMLAMNELIKDKTVLIIAHRLSTITQADQIVVFDRGKVVGNDSHSELLQNCPVYQKMWNAYTRSKDFSIQL